MELSRWASEAEGLQKTLGEARRNASERAGAAPAGENRLAEGLATARDARDFEAWEVQELRRQLAAPRPPTGGAEAEAQRERLAHAALREGGRGGRGGLNAAGGGGAGPGDYHATGRAFR